MRSSILLSFIFGHLARSAVIPNVAQLFPTFSNYAPSGDQLVWIRPETQGEIASTPSPISEAFRSFSPLSEVQRHPDLIQRSDGVVHVPVFRRRDMPQSELVNDPTTVGEPKNRSILSVGTDINVHGASARLSTFNPYVRPSDSSSIELTLTRYGSGKLGSQVLKAGWMTNPVLFGDVDDPKPHLFTYFSTDENGGFGDNLRSWNRNYKGWVQVHTEIYPGCVFVDHSIVDERDASLLLSFKLHEDNWWLFVEGEGIGYYPVSLFSDGRNVEGTLAVYADETTFSGVVADYGKQETGLPTAMGSGIWPCEGFGRADYFKNMKILNLGEQQWVDFQESKSFADDTGNWQLYRDGRSAPSWESFIFIGGTGVEQEKPESEQTSTNGCR